MLTLVGVGVFSANQTRGSCRRANHSLCLERDRHDVAGLLAVSRPGTDTAEGGRSRNTHDIQLALVSTAISLLCLLPGPLRRERLRRETLLWVTQSGDQRRSVLGNNSTFLTLMLCAP